MSYIRALFVALFALTFALPAMAQTVAPGDEAAIRRLLDDWYGEHRKGADGRPNRHYGPVVIDASPGFIYADTGAAVLGPRVYVSLASQALQFRHEITTLVADARFARVHVRERGYFYAWAAQQTYERMASAIFVLEKQDDGRWLVLAHESNSVGFPPSIATNPLPDLRALYYATQGRERDPDEDARNARQ